MRRQNIEIVSVITKSKQLVRLFLWAADSGVVHVKFSFYFVVQGQVKFVAFIGTN